jgi:hypothetical protein
MLVTEEEAKQTKWCPMIKLRWQSRPVTFNRSNPGPRARFNNWIFRTFFPRWHFLMRGNFFRCYGSGCMMWRWEKPLESAKPNGKKPEDKKAQAKKAQERLGYCGLAGMPLLNFIDGQRSPDEEL